MAHVFISYHKNSSRAYARKLADHLIAGGFDVWIDDRINLGSSWSDEIFKAIKTCGAFIVIMTPGAETSEWVKREYLNAERYQKPQFPLLLDGENFPYYTPVQYTDVRGDVLPGENFFTALTTAGATRGRTPGTEIAGAAQQAAQSMPQALLPREAQITASQSQQYPGAVGTTHETSAPLTRDNPRLLPPLYDSTSKEDVPPTDTSLRGRRLLLLLSALIVVVGAAALIVPGLLNRMIPLPSDGGGSGQIAFTSQREDGGEIILMNSDGSDLLNVSDFRGHDHSPTWSPDGTQIAFVSDREVGGEIYVMTADGSNIRRLSHNNTLDSNPVWSPDGMQIAFVSVVDEARHQAIYVIDVDGSNFHRLINDQADTSSPAWSPDGTQIAYVLGYFPNRDIYVIDSDGANVRRVTNNQVDDYAPAWSPDGTQIVFVSNRDQGDEIYAMSADGSNVKRLTNGGIPNTDPAWSPDGLLIAFTSYRDGNDEIYVMTANGSNTRRLTYNDYDDSQPAWRP